MFLPEGEIQQMLATYGPWALAVIIGLESMGLPLPGETALILASIYASTHDRNIAIVIAAATAGAIIGDNIGYMIGREFGFRLLRRWGPRLGLTDGRVKLGQYLFMRHGAKVVFFGRFVAILRVLAAFLAGVNQMPWNRFFAANAAGAIIWATVIGMAAFTLGRGIQNIQGPLGIAGIALAVVAFVTGAVFLKRHEAELQVEAERALPGPVRQRRGKLEL